jgi:hypothetical protein
MTDSRTYQPTEIEQRLAAWLVASLDQFYGIEIAYQSQGHNRLERPFVTLQVLTDYAAQDPIEQVLDVLNDDGTYRVQISELRSGSVQVIAYGNNSWSVMRAVARSLRRQSVIDLNTSNGIDILMGLSPIQDIPEPMSTQTEPRRQQDFMFSYFDVTIYEDSGAGVIERVIATGDLYNQTPGDGVNPEVDESWPTP